MINDDIYYNLFYLKVENVLSHIIYFIGKTLLHYSHILYPIDRLMVKRILPVGNASHGGGQMNKRRELTLQRLSHIGNLSAAEKTVKPHPTGMLTIEAALGAYMSGAENVPDLHTSFQMAEYMAAVAESRHVNSNAGKKYDRLSGIYDKEYREKTRQALETDKSAQYQLKHYAKKQEEPSAYDSLDANRCAGFLLYSYNKNGVHSVLGENISFGSYGGRISEEGFISKA